MLTERNTQRFWEIYLKERGQAWLKVASGSMSPMIPIGASILVKRCYFEDVKASDIIVFKSKEKFIVHRVLGRNKDQVLQAGDNFSSPSFIDKSCVLGQVILINNQQYVIDLEKRKNKFLNAMISVNYVLARKIPNHNYRLLKMNSNLMNLMKESSEVVRHTL